MLRIETLGDTNGQSELEKFGQEFPPFDDIALRATEDAERDARVDASCPYRTANHLGKRAYDQMHLHLGTSLAKLGFRGEDRQCQMRHVHERGYRVLVARGHHIADRQFAVCPKGRLTRELIRENEAALGCGTLFSGLMDEPNLRQMLNLWVFVEAMEQGRLTVYLLIPVSVDRSGCIIYAAEWEELGNVSVEDSVPVVPVSPRDTDPVHFEIKPRNVARK